MSQAHALAGERTTISLVETLPADLRLMHRAAAARRQGLPFPKESSRARARAGAWTALSPDAALS
jgi:hypothetical protein